jgi:hypothetical protein
VLALGLRKSAKGEPALALTYTTQREGKAEAFGNVTADRLKEAGALVPLDAAWHTLSITVVGNRHAIGLDGVELFSGETDVTDGGALVLGPGWGNWSPGPLDVDDLVVRKNR